MVFLNKKNKAKIYISTLVDRMLDKQDAPARSFGRGVKAIFASDSSRWKALREAEALQDYKYFEATKGLLEEETDKKRKDRYYFILIRFWKKTNDEKILVYILNSLSMEKEDSFVSQQLSFIGQQYTPIEHTIPIIEKFLDESR